MKMCTRCPGTKDESEFHGDGKGGLKSWCKKCCASHMKERRAIYRVRIHEEDETSPTFCPRCESTKMRKDFYPKPTNATGISTYCRTCENTRITSSLQRHKATKQRADRNHRQTLSYKISNVAKDQRRRAAKRGAERNDFTAAQWLAMKKHYDYRCVYCQKKTIALTQDHLTPLSKGGSHTASNIVPACHSCNSRKHTGDVLCPVQPLLLAV